MVLLSPSCNVARPSLAQPWVIAFALHEISDKVTPWGYHRSTQVCNLSVRERPVIAEKKGIF